MSELGQISEEEATDPLIIAFVDEEGNELIYAINMVIEHDDKRFALMSEVEMVDDLTVPTESPEIFVARIDTDEDHEELYVDPTEEEFKAIMEIVEQFKEDAEE
jgi:uncharacterized protein YrzB (UPF0473 family)